MFSNLKHSELRALVGYYLIKWNYSKQDLALKIGISPASLYRKLNDPEAFTFGEFQILIDILNLTPEQKLKVV